MKNNAQTTDYDLNTIQGFNAYLKNSTNAYKEVKAALKYFSHNFRKSDPNDVDEFVLMTKEQVQLFQKLNTNPQVKVKIEWYDDTQQEIYCYILYRTHKKRSLR